MSGREADGNYDPSDAERYPHQWGYTDTRFEFDGPRSVRVTGSRYPLAGYSLPGFIPFVESELGLPIRPEDSAEPNARPAVTPARPAPEFLDGLRKVLGPSQVSADDRDRLVHSHGQLSVDEVYRLLYGPSLARAVDAVVYPASEEEVRAVVALARSSGVCLVPYGGGTNVSGALALPAGETRPVASVDMSRMNRILWVDEENRLACVEAGITGKELERALGARGYTSGHEPDSIELSTLGGWISTNASGMKKNRYGNIEDVVLEATLVTPAGDLESRSLTPRNSAGVPPRAFLFGSEGNFGVITKAVIKVHPLPPVRRYGSLLFRSFADGVRFLRELRESGVLPASIRLVNNKEFRFGQALKGRPGPLQGLVRRLQKLYLLRVLGFEPERMAACTVVMEGSEDEVRHQRRTLHRIARRHRAVSGGASNGRRGYMLTFGIAYIRDFFNRFGVLGETFETSVPWTRIHDVCGAVERELAEQCRARGVAGKPYLSYRVTQTYHTGVCIYFTMGLSGKGLADPAGIYHDVESRLRQAILDHGGSLSHHHGVGKVRASFLGQVQSETTARVLREAKHAMDPENVFGAGNGVFAPGSAPP